MTTDEKIRFVAEKVCGWRVSPTGTCWVTESNWLSMGDWNPCESLDDCAIAEACIVRNAREYSYYLALLAIIEKDSGKTMSPFKTITGTSMQRVDAMIRAFGGEP